jgi:hypothetical protein
MADATKPFTERPVLGRFTQNYAQQKGFFAAAGESLKQGGGDIKNGINVFDKATEGKRLGAFGRVAGVGVGSYIALGALQSRDADGNERSGLVRVGQAVLGTGIAAGSLIVGHGR